MTEFLEHLRTLDQEQATIALFAGILVFSVATLSLVAAVRSLGKWGTVAGVLALAAVVIAYKVSN